MDSLTPLDHQQVQSRGPSSSEQAPGSDAGGMLELLTLLLRYRHLVLAWAVAVAVVAVTVRLLSPRSYTVGASFVPQTSSGSGLSNFAGLAAQFGISAPRADPGASPDFYVELLQSRTLLRQLVLAEYRLPGRDSSTTGTLIEGFGIGPGSEAEQIADGIKKLRKHIAVSTNRRTSLVFLTVRTRDPELSRAVAAQALELLNAFNLSSRQSQARQERVFVEARLAESQSALFDAEEQVGEFLKHNRQFGNSPQLSFELDRLQRKVAQVQQVYTALVSAYEQARIAEVRDTPVITVVEVPVQPARPDGRGTIRVGLVALLVGMLLGGLMAWWLEYLRRSKAQDSRLTAEFETLRRETSAELRRLAFPFRRKA